MSAAFDFLDFGPKGGHKEDPKYYPNLRKKELNADLDPATNLPQLHRFEKQDAAYHGLKNEQPWHRMAAIMLIHGHTNSEIALHAGVTPQHVSNVRAQRWFQQLLATLANEQGQEVSGLLAAEAVASIETMVALRDFGESERVRLAAAQALFEHANGKAVQKTIIHSTTSRANFSTPEEELVHIEAQIRDIRQANSITVESVELDQTTKPNT